LTEAGQERSSPRAIVRSSHARADLETCAAESATCSCPLCLSREFSQVVARKLCWRTDIGADDQPCEANFSAIQAWNAAPVYQRAIAIIGRQIDGG
jgi:hypothetical protein